MNVKEKHGRLLRGSARAGAWHNPVRGKTELGMIPALGFGADVCVLPI